MDKKKVLNEVRIFLLMLLVVTSLRSALADWNDVPTGSMKPTIQEGDRVVVNKLAYDLKVPFTTVQLARWSDPMRGDIVVLFSPQDGVRLVKRVMALPGDQIAMQDNVLFVNGVPAKLDPLEELTDPEVGIYQISDETLFDVKHKVMLTPGSPSPMRSFSTRIVPPGTYFVLGDNRDNSNDSRYIGYIERRRIVGRATAVAFSLDRNHYYIPRFNRFFKDLD